MIAYRSDVEVSISSMSVVVPDLREVAFSKLLCCSIVDPKLEQHLFDIAVKLLVIKYCFWVNSKRSP